MTKLNRIAVVVPLYLNHSSLYPIVENFFQSLRRHYPDLPLVVVDDASLLPHDFPVSLRHQTNRGFTKTVNDGLKYATKRFDPDVYIIANDDLVFKAGDLDRFFTLNPRERVIASPSDTADSPDDKWGAIWGMTRATWLKLGLLNERYQDYFSDNDYYHRAQEARVKIVKWTDIIVEHVEGATYRHVDRDSLAAQDYALYCDLEKEDAVSRNRQTLL